MPVKDTFSLTPSPSTTPTATPTPSPIVAFTPTITLTTTPSPLLSANPSLATVTLSPFQLYESQPYGFSIIYPSDFRLVEQPAQPGILLWLGFTAPDDPGAPNQYEPALGLIIYDNPEKRSLDDWLTAHWGDAPEMGQRPTQPVIFFNPNVVNHDPLQDHPALQYESGAWPIRYEKLVVQNGWVIGIYFHRDHPIDYEQAYQKLLVSLKLFTPALPATTPVLNSPTPVVCLDENAVPQSAPIRPRPLEVRFISDGNIWVWEEGKRDHGQQISKTGDAIRISFSPDGQVIAFERPAGENPQGSYGSYKIELWAVNRDGSGLRRLVSAEQFDALLDAHNEPSWAANMPTDYRWLPGTHQLTFGVYAAFNALGWSAAAQSYWMVDTTTLKLSARPQAEKIDPYAPHPLVSPDGRKAALIDREKISLFHADGSVILENALSYAANPCGESPCWSAPTAVWTSDSESLFVLVWDKDIFGDSFSTWRVPTDGSPATLVATFIGTPYSIHLSPDQRSIAYLRRANTTSTLYELHLARLDGSRDVDYANGYQLQIEGWSPDAYHFIYVQPGVYQPWLGSVCGPAQALLDLADSPASEITWLDAARFLYVQSQPGEFGPLRLGHVNGPTLRIGPKDGKVQYYETK